jgi:tetratricopeptide (TPR) repeat protein
MTLRSGETSEERGAPSGGRDFPRLDDRYRIRGFLGSGLDKRVYLADDLELGRRVAVAEVSIDHSPAVDINRLHEIRAMARIEHHPHIVPIYDVLELPHAIYIVTPYFAGGDLASLLHREGRLPFSMLVDIGRQLCTALSHIHAHGVTHRDVNPKNIFVAASAEVALGDFGLAASDDVASSYQGVVGTPSYMAPEQKSGAPPRPSADLYSLGCVLFEMATGRPPVTARSATELHRLHRSVRPLRADEMLRSLPLAFCDLVSRLLENDPLSRPATAADVHMALAGFSQDADTDHRLASIVARNREISEQSLLLTEAQLGRPAVLLLRGVAGIGKSSVLRSICRQSEASGVFALVGRGHDGARIPYAPIVEALRPLAGRLSDLDDETANLVRRFLSAYAESPGQELHRLAESERRALFRALCDALTVWSRRSPLCVVFDDIHWADSASADLFGELASVFSTDTTAGGARILLVAAFRPDAVDKPLERALERVGHVERCRTVDLEGLDEAGVVDLLRFLSIPQPSDQLVQKINGATKGNPLFVKTLVGRLRREGALEERHGYTVCTAGNLDAFDPSLTTVIRERVESLDEPDRDLLGQAAILGDWIAPGLLRALVGGARELIDAGLQRAVDEASLVQRGANYEFVHPLVRHAFYHDVAPERRSWIHARVADLLMESGSPDPVELAFHLIRSGDATSPSRVVAAALAAGDHALASFAWNEATDFFEAAIQRTREHGLDATVLGELHRKAGQAYLGRFDKGPCLHHFDGAIEAYHRDGNVQGLTLALTGKVRARCQFGLVGYGSREDVGPLEECLELLGPGDHALRARVLGMLAEASWYAQEPERSEVYSLRALDVATRSGDDALCAEGSIWRALAYLQQMRLHEALTSFRDGLAHARRAGDLLRAEEALQRIPLILLLTGRLRDAVSLAHEALGQHRMVRSTGDHALTLALLVSLAVIVGDGELAETRAREALELAERSRYPWPSALTLPAIAYLRTMRNESGRAYQAIDKFLTPGIVFDDPEPLARMTKPYYRLIDLYGGDKSQITDADLDISWMHGMPVPFDFALIPSVCLHVELVAAAGKVIDPLAENALAAAAEAGMLFTVGWPFFIPRIRGIAARSDGRLDEAAEHFRHAIAEAGRSGVSIEIIRSRLDYALLLAMRAGEGDFEEASAQLRLLPSLRTGSIPEALTKQAEGLAFFLRSRAGEL